MRRALLLVAACAAAAAFLFAFPSESLSGGFLGGLSRTDFGKLSCKKQIRLGTPEADFFTLHLVYRFDSPALVQTEVRLNGHPAMLPEPVIRLHRPEHRGAGDNPIEPNLIHVLELVFDLTGLELKAGDVLEFRVTLTEMCAHDAQEPLVLSQLVSVVAPRCRAGMDAHRQEKMK